MWCEARQAGVPQLTLAHSLPCPPPRLVPAVTPSMGHHESPAHVIISALSHHLPEAGSALLRMPSARSAPHRYSEESLGEQELGRGRGRGEGRKGPLSLGVVRSHVTEEYDPCVSIQGQSSHGY